MRTMLALAGALVTMSTASLADSSAVTVHRGPGSGPLPKLERPEARRDVLAGERIWIVDRDAGMLTGCRLEGTTQVGRRRLACARRALPEG